MKSKPIALIATAVLAVTTLSACTAQEQEPKIELELLTWHGPDSLSHNYEGYQEIIDAYEADHPDVQITIKSEEDASYGNILETGFAGGTAPDIIQMKSGQRSTFATNLLDLREYLAAENPYADDTVWMDTFVGGEAAFPVEDNGTNANSILFVPNDGNPEVFAGPMYAFNKKIVEDAGLDPDKTPKDWKELFEWLEALDGNDDIAPIAGSNDLGRKVSQIGYGFGEHYADKFFDEAFNDAELSNDIFTDKLYVLTNYAGGAQMPLTDLPYYPAMFSLIKQHISYFQESWTENSPETETLTFASGKAALVLTSFWDFGSLQGALSEATFPDGYGLFQLPYFGNDTLPYALDKGWITEEEADAAEPFVVDRPATASGAGRHEYGFTVNAATAEDPEKLEATIDFLQFLSSPDVQKQYVETAQSLSPVVGVDVVESLQPFVVAEPEGGFAEQVLGYSVVEWGKAGWDVTFNQYLAGDMTWQELVKGVAYPEWAADIPDTATLAAGVTDAQTQLDGAAAADKEGKERALAFAKLREGLYNTYYHSMTGDLTEKR